MVHALSYVPERRGRNTDMIEEPVELRDVRLSLRTDGRKPRRVYLAPREQPLEFQMKDGYVTANVPVVPGYAMVVVEGP